MNGILKPLVIEILLTLVLTLLLTMLWLLVMGNTPLESLTQAPSLMLMAMPVGLVVWLVLLILVRRRTAQRSAAARFWWSFLAAGVAAFLNVIVLSVVGLVAGGWAALLLVFVFLATTAFAVGAVIANALTTFVIAKPAAPAPAMPSAGPVGT